MLCRKHGNTISAISEMFCTLPHIGGYGFNAGCKSTIKIEVTIDELGSVALHCPKAA